MPRIFGIFLWLHSQLVFKIFQQIICHLNYKICTLRLLDSQNPGVICLPCWLCTCWGKGQSILPKISKLSSQHGEREAVSKIYMLFYIYFGNEQICDVSLSRWQKWPRNVWISNSFFSITTHSLFLFTLSKERIWGRINTCLLWDRLLPEAHAAGESSRMHIWKLHNPDCKNTYGEHAHMKLHQGERVIANFPSLRQSLLFFGEP